MCDEQITGKFGLKIKDLTRRLLRPIAASLKICFITEGSEYAFTSFIQKYYREDTTQ